jgi:L-lactate dehydrogenase complex protein LldG
MSGRDEIMARVRDALKGRATIDHPGEFGGWRPEGALSAPPTERLASMLQAAGGEVVRAPSDAAAAEWLARFCTGFDAVAVGTTVPEPLRPSLPLAAPDVAPLGISMARGAVAETGSLLLDSRDGRRTQLLPPTHVVFVRAVDVHATFRDALLAMKGDLPSAIGLHSGPSRSADIGQVMVKGVHGPGRLVAVILGASARAP